MAQPITSDQEEQIICLVVDAATAAAKTALIQATFLDKDSTQQVIERGDALKVEVERAISNILKKLGSRYPVLTETRLLKPVAQAIIPARTRSFNASEFYRTSPGLYVDDTFADRLDLKVMQTVDSAPERPYVASLLKANAYEKDIRKELPETHLSTFEDIAYFIEVQSNGQSGLLLNNGHSNIFYVEGKEGVVFVVSVLWLSDYSEWFVHVWSLDEFGYWGADSHVLCPGTVAL